MEKENKNVMTWIIMACIVLVGAGCFYLGTEFIKKDSKSGNTEINKESAKEEKIEEKDEMSEEEALAFVTKEINILINGLNNKGQNSFCPEPEIDLLQTDMVDNYFIHKGEVGFEYYSDNFWDNFGPVVMNCVYGDKYEVLYSGFIGTYILMNDEQYQKYNDYFDNGDKLTLFDDYDYNFNKECTECKNESDYLNKKYRVAYTHGDGYGASEITFKLVNITKSGDYYDVTISAASNYDPDVYSDIENFKYEGTFKVEIKDNHLKYHELNFTKK